MADREKVRKGFEAHGCGKSVWRICSNCPYREEDDPFFDPRITPNYDSELIEKSQKCMNNLLKDAYSLLKAQEPRVMTVREFQRNDGAVYLDEPGNPVSLKMLYCYEIGSGKTIYHGYTFVDSSGDKIFFPAKDFNKKWRCWTSRPSDAQRKAVKWDE